MNELETSVVKRINVHQLKELYDANPDLCLIDVREPHEWQEVSIPDALLVPQGELPEAISEIAPHFDEHIYLHCRRGSRSLTAALTLLQMGYQNVYSIDGGIEDWVKHEYEHEKGEFVHGPGCC